MPLPGGLWWLLCCRRGFTLLHRDYGDGELSGDGDEDEDEETFELRTPSPAGGGRVSPRGVWSLVSTPLTTTGRQPSRAPAAARLGICLWASRSTLGAVHLLGALRQGRCHAWPDLALPLPSPPGPRPISSPSASASAEECGEAGWAARTPGSAPLPVHERRELGPDAGVPAAGTWARGSRLFLALQALEGARRPGPLMQGVLQTCRDLPALRDELFLQLAKQTSGPAGPPGPPATQDPAALRYWQLLTCMSCTFRPGGAVRGHLLGHLERTEQALPDSELAEYARFIRRALGRTRGRELVPSLAEISALSRRQELLCTVHCPGAGACPVAIDSHTTAGEVARELVGRLGLTRSRNTFALYEQRGAQERALAGGTLVADVLTRFENLAAEEAGLEDPPDTGWLQSWEETRSLIPEKGPSEDDPDVVVKGWLYREPRGGGARPWLPPRRAWFVLTRDSLDQFSSSGKGARRLGSLVLTSLCSVSGPERRPKETGLWSVTVSGRKHSVRLCSPRQSEAECWGVALREVIASKAPLETPTQLLLRDIQRLRGMGRAEAMAAYLALAAQCPGFGAARYDVLELSTEPGGGAPQKLCLGLGAKAMSLSRPGETEPIHSVSYGRVAACQLMGPHTLALRVGESQLLLQSPQVEEIVQLVNAYLANPSPERPSSSPPPCQDLPDTSPPSQHPGLDEPQGQSGCLGQLQD
ncbi:PREDICTED: pleckstrin homology domain-containing family H member 3 [Bison bison bison]|uniref:Pleckstrin homology domain-containing family H member 3 n=1 Tax=Bison bison bison TaxID=43346 RepID=A0A6P3HGM2_BISBB|nr:PREDICTED: pleckstrin homology domain-containing family H member 3 [Bison bison bison]